MIQRFKTYIETSDWEDKIPAWEWIGNAIAHALMTFSVIFWAFGILKAVLP